MASGDPPVTGNPADSTGTITIEAIATGNNNNVLRVKLKKNKRLEITIDKGDGTHPIPIVAHADKWHMLITEID